MTAAGKRVDQPSLDDLKAELSDRAEDLARDLMGPPNRETARGPEYRWGSKGSVGFFVRDGRGKRQGLFSDFEGDTSGSPLDFIMHARSCNLAEAIRWSEHWLGYDRPDYVPAPANDAVRIERARKRAEQEREAAAALEERAAYARKLWDEAVPAAGTAAELYLTDARRIPAPPLGWSGAVRFHPRSRSLIVAATRDAGARGRTQPGGALRSPRRPPRPANGSLLMTATRAPADDGQA